MTFHWQNQGLRYYSYSHFIKEKFGERVQRVTLDIGSTCPNIDGTVARGGCIYCNDRSFSPAKRRNVTGIKPQIDDQISRMRNRYKCEKFFAYFQSGTNTYADITELKALYDEAVSHPSIVGLIVGTRPDCLNEEFADLFEEYAKKMYVGLEVGIQSIHDKSLQLINRGHNAQCFFDALEILDGRGIDVGTHLILGLPGETYEDMIETAKVIGSSKLSSVKIHNLHVSKKTRLEILYERGDVPILEMKEYIDLLVDVIEYISPDKVLHRVMGDVPREDLVAPDWVLNKQLFLRELEKTMLERDSWQGKKLMDIEYTKAQPYGETLSSLQ